MKPAATLAVAVACGALSIALVAADVAYSLQARLEAFDDGTWVEVAQVGPDRYYVSYPGMDCSGPQFRLIVDNDKPLGDTVAVEASFYNHTAGRTEWLVQEEATLGPFEQATYGFVVPDSARQPRSQDGEPVPRGDINVQVGDYHLRACADWGAAT